MPWLTVTAARVFPQAHNRLHAQKAVLAHLLGGMELPSQGGAI